MDQRRGRTDHRQCRERGGGRVRLADYRTCARVFRRRVGFALADGQAVLVRGTITVYEARGQYQIQVAEIRPRGQGSLQQRFEELKRKLTGEGLFAPERKRPLPALASSPDSAASVAACA